MSAPTTAGIDERLSVYSDSPKEANTWPETFRLLTSHRFFRPLILFAIVLTAYLISVALTHKPPTGDEPHYLLIAQSLYHDHDLNLANNYANPAQVQIAYPHSGLLGSHTHAAVYRPNGPLVPIHGVGLPLLLVPVIATGHSWLAARMLMALISALIAPLMLLTVDRMLPRRRVLSFVAVITTALTAPLFTYSGQIYPDVPGALLVAAGVTFLVIGGDRTRWLVLASTAAALLPWFHVRFLIFTAALAVALIVRTARVVTGSESGRSRSEHIRKWAAVFAPLLVSGVGFLYYNQHLYGSVSPTAAYRIPQFAGLAFTATNLYRWSIGDILSPTEGVAPLAPVILLSIAGSAVVIYRWRWWGGLGVGTVLVYYLFASGTAGGGGACPPGRWIVAFAPLLAIPLAAALAANWRSRVVFVVLAGYSAAISCVITMHFKDLYPNSAHSMSLPLATSVAPIWPDTIPGIRFEILTNAAALQHTVGRIVGTAVTTVPGQGAGLLTYGPRAPMRPGSYIATFELPLVEGTAGSVAGTVSVVSGRDVLETRNIIVPSIGHGALSLSIEFYTTGSTVQLRVRTYGVADITVRDITALPQAPGAIKSDSIGTSLPMTLLWGGIFVLLVMMVLGSPTIRRTDGPPALGPLPLPEGPDEHPANGPGSAYAPDRVDLVKRDRPS